MAKKNLISYGDIRRWKKEHGEIGNDLHRGTVLCCSDSDVARCVRNDFHLFAIMLHCSRDPQVQGVVPLSDQTVDLMKQVRDVCLHEMQGPS